MPRTTLTHTSNEMRIQPAIVVLVTLYIIIPDIIKDNVMLVSVQHAFALTHNCYDEMESRAIFENIVQIIHTEFATVKTQY